jgi:hypothetical protein
MITTTLRQLRQHSPCSEGWRTLLSYLGKTGADDDPLPLVTILQSNGLDDALWCLRTITGHDKEIIRFALACAQDVRHLMTDRRLLDALDALERHLEIPLSREELDRVLVAAEWAAGAAARAAEAAARAAAWSARAAAEAAVEAAWATEAAAWAAEAAQAAQAARAAEAAAEAAARSARAAWTAAWEAARAAEAAAGAEARARQSQIFEEIFG